jgi:hypothetical protein
MKSLLYEHKNPLILLTLVAGCTFLYLQPTPVAGEENSTLCFFHFITGLPCPACGTGRGLICILHGAFYEAWMFNPLSYVVAALSILVLLTMLRDWLHKSDSIGMLMKARIPFTYQIPFWLLLLINEIWNIQKGL